MKRTANITLSRPASWGQYPLSLKLTIGYLSFRNTLRLLSVVGLLLILISCDKDPITRPDPDGLAEYTVMFYGCAGGNLDGVMNMNFEAILAYGSTEKVQATVQCKFSADSQQGTEYPSGTRRYVVGDGVREDESVMDVMLPFYEPENLSDFIVWSKTHCPAKKYILVLYGHGDGFNPDENMSRAAVWDDNLDRDISINELVSGVKQSGTHLEVVYYHSCLMNMLENLAEIAEIANYSLAYGHSSPSYVDHGALLTALNDNTGTVEAFRQFCDVTLFHWNHIFAIDPQPYNIVFTDLKKLPDIFDIVREISEELCRSYGQYKEEYNNMTDEFFYRYDPEDAYVDIASYTEWACIYSMNPYLMGLSSRLYKASQHAILYQVKSINCPEKLTWSITFVNRKTWEYNIEIYKMYDKIKFDLATGWSNWLRLNETPNCGFTNPASLPE